MKKPLFSIILILGIVSVFLILYQISKRDLPEPITLSPDYPQWHLPDGVKTRFGKGSVEKIQYSPDGKILAVVSRIGIWLYDAHSGEVKSLLSAHSRQVADIAFTPDSQTLACGNSEGTISFWDVSTGTHKNTLKKNRCGHLPVLRSLTMDTR